MLFRMRRLERRGVRTERGVDAGASGRFEKGRLRSVEVGLEESLRVKVKASANPGVVCAGANSQKRIARTRRDLSFGSIGILR